MRFPLGGSTGNGRGDPHRLALDCWHGTSPFVIVRWTARTAKRNQADCRRGFRCKGANRGNAQSPTLLEHYPRTVSGFRKVLSVNSAIGRGKATEMEEAPLQANFTARLMIEWIQKILSD